MKDMLSKVHDAMCRQIQSRGYTTPVDVLIDIGVLDKTKYDDWRAGRVPFLEAVCTANLHKLSEVMKEIRNYSARVGLKQSVSRSCLACKRKCEERCHCFWKDDLSPVIDRIFAADALIIGSPIYLGDITSQVHGLIERLHFCALSYDNYSLFHWEGQCGHHPDDECAENIL